MIAYRIADEHADERGNLIACASWPDDPDDYLGPASFGEALRRRRLAAGLSQKKLGRIVGIKKQTISRYENSHCEPRPVCRYALRCALSLGEHDDGGWWETDY